MLKHLEDNKAAIAKGLRALIAETIEKKKELGALNQSIKNAREEIESERIRFNNILSGHNAEIVAKEDRNEQLDIRLKLINSKREEEMNELLKKIVSLMEGKSSLEDKMKESSRILQETLSEESVLQGRVTSLKDQIGDLEKQALVSKTVVDRLVSLSKDLLKQVDTLRETEAQLNKNIVTIKNRQVELDKYHSQLRAKESSLKEKEDELEEVAQKAFFMFEKSAEIVNLPLKKYGVSK